MGISYRGRMRAHRGGIVNNKGVFQGSSISAILYIMLAGGIVTEYKRGPP